MNAEEIRSLNHACQKEINETETVRERQFGVESLNASMLTEVAAQLAELNEKLKIILNPPVMYDKVDIDPADFSGLSNQRITVTEPQLTLRDQFAMAALNGLFSGNSYEFWVLASLDILKTTSQAYKWADKMMEARRER
jgi:lactate dehydrogenase-like 2-hydroxyacid dehydrogenase